MDTKAFKTALTLGTASLLAWPAAAQTGSAVTNQPTADSAPPVADRDQATVSSDIIVTARRVEERLQDVPISITVFNQNQISNRNIINASDLAVYTPSLSANSNFGQENSSFAIRGFVQDPGTQPSVGVYFADVVALRGPTQGTQAGDGAGPGSFFDLQNVQVLKGPQGTLFGRNTTGGAVLFVPQAPTGRLEGYLEGSVGSRDMRRVQGAVNVPLSDIARFRLAGDYQTRDGWLRNRSGIGPRDYNDLNYFALRGTLALDLTPNLTNSTLVSFSRSDTNGSVQKLVGCNPTGLNPTSPAQIGAGIANFVGLLSCGQLAAEQARGAGYHDVQASVPNPRSLVEQWQVINTTTWAVNDETTIKNIASYGQFRNVQRSPLFGANWSAATLNPIYQQVFFRGVPSSLTGIFPAPGADTAHQYTTTEELQLQGSAIGGRLTYQAGAYYEYSGPLGAAGNQSPTLAVCSNLAAITCIDPLGAAFTAAASAQASAALGFPITIPIRVGAVNYTVGRTKFRNVGLYSQASFAITDALKLTGGIRYTWDRQSNNSTRITYQFPVVPPFTGATTLACTDPGTAPSCANRLRQSSDRPTWLVGLDYKPGEDVLLYGKWTRGYRAGGVFPNAPIGFRTFEPEKVDSYEVGVKAGFDGFLRSTVNLSGFYNDFSNQQLQFGFDARVDPATGATAPVSPTTAVVNAGTSRIWGIEAEASIAPFAGFRLDASYAYLNTKIRRIDTFTTTDPNYQVSTQIPVGAPLILSPKNKVSATASYTLPLDETAGRVTLAATYTHTDRQRTNYAYLTNPGLVALFGRDFGLLPATDLLNVNVNWAGIGGRPIDLSAFATNVTGEKYFAFVAGLGTSGSEYATLGEPRMYGVRLRYRFGG